MVWDGSPRTREEVAREVYRRSSEDNRRGLLNLHTHRALAKARKALENPWKWAGQQDALKILVEAAPAYERLGGDLDPWALEPADWEALIAPLWSGGDDEKQMRS